MNYIEHLLILASTSTGCVSIPALASAFGILVGIKSSAVGSKICIITEGIKTYNSIIKKKRTKDDKTVLLAKAKLSKLKS